MMEMESKSKEEIENELAVLGQMDVLIKSASKPIKLTRSRYDPIDVYPWFEITVQNVDCAEQIWHASIEIHLFWQDYTIPVLCPYWQETGFNLKEPELDAPLKLSEIFENKVWQKCQSPIYKYLPETSTIHMQIFVTVEFVERMELHRFPFDRQFLAMDFNGWTGPDPNHRRFNWNWILNPPEWVTQTKYRKPFAVRMLSSITEYGLKTPWVDFSCQQPLKIRLRVERLVGYYFSSIILPNALICFAAFSSLAIPIDDSDSRFIEERLAVTVTLMLTAVVFKYVITEQLPKVTYLTIMDYYLLFGFVMLITLIAENALSGLDRWSVAMRYEIEKWIGCIFGLIWVVTHIFWLIVLWNKNFLRASWAKMDELDQDVLGGEFRYAHKCKARPQSQTVLDDFYARVNSNSMSGK